ncbi:MAG TPA: type IV toxin-antitoxin system AbiEi family antitoxin [Conexibacter sp.]|nr:type IV toxin-antitoxin system AbiEi family antitoxin [Conexibacter sp.]
MSSVEGTLAPDDAFIRLARAATLAGRPDVVVLVDDLPSLPVSRRDAHVALDKLERSGRIQRVRRGAYALVDSTGNVRVDLLDLIAALTPDPYLVSGGRALQLHGLTDQHFRRVHVLVPHALRSWSWRGDDVRYVSTGVSLRGGATRARPSRARIAPPERAIADSLSHPRWGVTLAQVAEALDAMLARDRTFADRLAREAVRQRSHALARRLGLLVSHLAGPDAARPLIPLRGDSRASALLQAGGPPDGPTDARWRVRVNVDLDRLLQHREVG